MKQLTSRQHHILNFIQSKGHASNADILGHLEDRYDTLSRVTIVRDLDTMIKQNLIQKTGSGRGVQYNPSQNNPLLRYIDPIHYFKTEQDHRNGKHHFNHTIFTLFGELFTTEEIKKLTKLTKVYQKNCARLDPDHYKKEVERLTIELSWKSSQIEGNTYSLLDTEALIVENREAPGHPKTEAIMILNHKHVLDYCFSHPNDYHQLTIRKIEDLHRLLIAGLEVSHGLRHAPVQIIGTP